MVLSCKVLSRVLTLAADEGLELLLRLLLRVRDVQKKNLKLLSFSNGAGMNT